MDDIQQHLLGKSKESDHYMDQQDTSSLVTEGNNKI